MLHVDGPPAACFVSAAPSLSLTLGCWVGLQVCPPGKYAASPLSTTCLFCPPGSFSYYWGAPTCRTCLPGTYAASAGSLFCDICRCVGASIKLLRAHNGQQLLTAAPLLPKGSHVCCTDSHALHAVRPCREGTTTRAEGATQCEVMVADGSSSWLDSMAGSADVAVLLSFGLLLDGTSLESVSRWVRQLARACSHASGSPGYSVSRLRAAGMCAGAGVSAACAVAQSWTCSRCVLLSAGL